LRAKRNSFMTLDCGNLSRGDYVVEVKEGGTYNQIAPEQIETCDPGVLLTRVYDKDDFVVYEIAQESGSH
jgi:hypothetical protein